MKHVLTLICEKEGKLTSTNGLFFVFKHLNLSFKRLWFWDLLFSCFFLYSIHVVRYSCTTKTKYEERCGFWNFWGRCIRHKYVPKDFVKLCMSSVLEQTLCLKTYKVDIYDKIRFLICRYVVKYSLRCEPGWSKEGDSCPNG